MQAHDRVPDSGEHALDLVLAAFVEGELELPRPEAADVGGGRGPIVELDARAEALERLLGGLAFDLDLVDLLDAVARMGEPVRQRAVVGQEQSARGVGVQPADRHDPRSVVDELDDRPATLRVARRRDDAGRLVQEHVGERLRLERAPVELHAVGGADEGVELPGLAVDRDAPRLDQLVRSATGGDTRARKVGVEPHSRIIRLVAAPRRGHYAARMARDWSRGALDDLVVEPRIARAGQLRIDRALSGDAVRLRLPLDRIGAAGMCLLVGVMAACVYVWPALLIAQIMSGGFSGRLFWSILALSAVVASLIAWAITNYERGYWSRNWVKISDWVDPEPWK